MGCLGKESPLHVAARYGHLDCVRSLCDAGAAIKATTDSNDDIIKDEVRKRWIYVLIIPRI